MCTARLTPGSRLNAYAFPVDSPWTTLTRCPPPTHRPAAAHINTGSELTDSDSSTDWKRLDWREAVVFATSRERRQRLRKTLFRTAKCRPEFLSRGFIDLHAARCWAARFSALVQQPRVPSQRRPLCQPRLARCGWRRDDPCGAPPTVSRGPRAQPATRVRWDPQLDAGGRGDFEPRARRCRHGAISLQREIRPSSM